MSDKGASGKKKTREKTPRKAEGGCFCGLVRYRIKGEPLFIANCHCVMCRRASGAPFVTWVTLKADDFAFVKTLPARFASSSKAERSFCDQCGSPLTFQFKARRKFIDVTVGSLDDPDRFSPGSDIYVASRVSWVPLDPSLEKHDADLDND